MTKRKTIIVVGGSHGGPSAVARARQANENARIILIEQAAHVMWTQTSVRSWLSSGDELRTAFEQSAYFERRFNVEVRTQTRAVELDLDAHCLIIEKDKERKRLRFDSLIYAGGARSNELLVDGLTGPRVGHFRDFNDVATIQRAMKEGAKTATVVGCGFYGVEAALALKQLGLSVSIIEQKKRIMPSFSMTFAEAIIAKLKEAGIELSLGTHILEAEQKASGGLTLKLENGAVQEADLVIVCIGLSPRTSLLADAGAAVDADGLIRVDDSMATTLPHVYACGSSVSVPIAVTNQRKWMPHPAIVLRTAHIAGINAATTNLNRTERLKPFCGTLIVEIGETSFARTGLSEFEARLALSDDNVFVTTVFGSAEDSFFYQQEMCVRLLVDKAKNRVVGGEVYGQKGVLRTIDLLAVAVSEGWAPDKLIDLDMAYLMEAGPVFDPLKDAATRAKMAMLDNEQSLSAEKLALWLASDLDFRLVDVGETPLLSGRARKALHVPLENLRERLHELADNDSPIVLYSRSGYRSYLAQLLLKQRGVHNVFHLDGGLATLNLVAKG